MDDVVCWPYWMPEPERDDYSYAPDEQTNVRSEMDVGKIVRRVFDTDETVISCRVILDDCSAYWFEAFERWMLDQGSVWFAMPLWVAGVKQHYVCQFVDRPKMTEVQGFTNFITFDVRVKRRALTPVSGYENIGNRMLPKWPSQLPVLQDGYSYEIRNTDKQSGTNLTSVRRPEFDIDEVSITAKFYLNRHELNLLEWFEREILNHGARWFTIPLWIGGKMVTQIVRFSERPKITLDGFWAEVSTKMDLENRAMMDKLLVGWLALLSPEDLQLYASIIKGIVNSMSTLLVPDFWLPTEQCLGGRILYEWNLS